MSRTYPRNRYVPGTYKRTCDRCGFDFLRNELVKEPNTGLLVCRKDLDPADLSRRSGRVRKEDVRKFD